LPHLWCTDRYIASKDELFDLVLDAVHAEIGPAEDDWREVLRSLPKPPGTPLTSTSGLPT
jgi:hypothetical protein